MDWTDWARTVALGAVALAWVGIAVRLAQAERAMLTLPPAGAVAGPTLPGGTPWPALSVVVPARNEAAHVEAALGSLLAQDYPGLEVVAVDDRSDDGTEAILARLAAADARLVAHRVERLPAGWLGKTHALHAGAARARGEVLLFTDADVVFAPGALRAAVATLARQGLGHLTAAPRMVAPGWWERAFQATFALYFLLRCRVWALHRPGSAAYAGVGAFNLVRREAYERVGGHGRLALTVVDDVGLGLLLRRSGVPQAVAKAGEHLSVRWQAGFLASLGGLLKNVFADHGYRWAGVLGTAAVLLGLGPGPWVGLVWALGAALSAGGPAGPLPLAALATVLAASVVGAGLPALLVGAVARRSAGGTGLEGLVSPLMHAALAGVVLASAGLATLRGRLVWRDTAYPLAELRARTLRPRDLPRQGAVGWPGPG